MNKQIKLGDKNIDYTLKISSRSRRLRLTIASDGDLRLTVPKYFNQSAIDKFLTVHSQLILKKLQLVNSREKINYGSFKDSKIKALSFITSRLEYFSSLYNFKYNRVSVRDQKTRWGSCSKSKNLSFNYKLLFIPPDLADYVIVHELCHLQEMNHSRKFWALVASVTPDYLSKRKALKNLVL